MIENDTSNGLESAQGATQGKVSPQRPIRTIKDAKRMLGKLIREFQQGLVLGTDAKTLCYLLISFCQLVRDYETEERISKLEAIAKGRTDDENNR